MMASPEITYKDFSRLAKKRGWTVEMLVELFKSKTGIEDRIWLARSSVAFQCRREKQYPSGCRPSAFWLRTEAVHLFVDCLSFYGKARFV
jgi:hypothetical protein